MRVILQRVKQAKVAVEPDFHDEIKEGLLIFLGIEDADTQNDIDWLVRKISRLRIFSDDNGKMNLSLIDTGFEAMVVSQFTLHASTKKGTRPSFTKSAQPELAKPLYEAFTKSLKLYINREVKTGVFGGHMQVSLVNDGPVTIFIDSKEKY